MTKNTVDSIRNMITTIEWMSIVLLNTRVSICRIDLLIKKIDTMRKSSITVAMLVETMTLITMKKSTPNCPPVV